MPDRTDAGAHRIGGLLRLLGGMLVLALTVCGALGCATTKKTADADAGEAKSGKQEPAKDAADSAPARASVDTKDEAVEDLFANEDEPPAGSLAAATRRLASRPGVSIALMSGIENRMVGEAPDGDVEAAVKALAGAARCRVQVQPAYYFVYPSESTYDRVAEVSLAKQLQPSYDAVTADVIFSSGTKLFTVLAALGEASGRTFIADNGFAELPCGELAIRNAPIGSALEALLKSARVVGARIESTDEYVLALSPRNDSPADLLLNPDNLTESQQAFLARRVTVYLPAPPPGPARLVVTPGAERLEDALGALSAQIGVPVEAEPALRDFPVNPAVFNEVQVRTVLNLLLRQWLRSEYGYEVQSNRILIRTR